MKFLFLFIGLTGWLFADVNRHNEVQLWLRAGINEKIFKKNTLYIDTEMRYSQRASRLYYCYFQMLSLFPLCKQFEVGPGYRQIFSVNTATNQWRPIYNPLFQMIWNYEGKWWKLRFRSFSQYFIREHEPHQWQQRCGCEAISHLKLGQIRPYLSEEIFFRQRVGYSENRFLFGLFIPFKLTLEGRLYLMFRSLVETKEFQKVLGIQLYTTF